MPNTVNDVLKKLGGGRLGTVALAKTWEQDLTGRDARMEGGGLMVGGSQLNANMVDDQYRQQYPDGVLTQPGFAVTDALREKAQAGLPLFARGGRDQTETPAFKAWFGDWTLAVRARRLRETVLARVTGAEFGPGFDAEPISMPSLRAAAQAWAKANLVGVHAHGDVELEVRPSGIERAIQHGGAADKLRAFAALPDVLRDGVVVFDDVNPKNRCGRLLVVAGKVEIGGRARIFWLPLGGERQAVL